MENLYTPGKIRLHSGRYMDPFDPKPEDICIEDIAHGLSHQCRFGGHTQNFLSVAQHSIGVALLVSAEHKLAGLLHDASEAYLGDIPTPIKKRLPEYMEAEDRLMRIIADKFGFQYPLHQAVKEADRQALELEWKKCVLVSFESYKIHHRKEIFLKYFNLLTR